MLTILATGRRLAVGLFALLAAAMPAMAQGDADEERLALAREHVELFVVGQMIKDLVPAMSQQIGAGIRRENPSLPDEEITAVSERIATLMATRMEGDLPEMTARLMAAQFTADEIRALTAFYSTPDGRSIVGKMSSYSAAVMQAVVPYVQSIAPKITETAIDQLRQEGTLL